MLPKLNSLYLSHNKLESVGDIEHLKECKSLSVVDLSHNFIEDPDAVQVFSQMENIVSYFQLFLFLNFFNNLACN
jgi:dynein assembly factor 1